MSGFPAQHTSASFFLATLKLPSGAFSVLRCLFFALILIGPVAASWAESPPAAQRIVFVGDSITGLGRNREAGFINEMEKALRTTRPDTEWTLIALGGSGQSVKTWRGIEEKSRTQELTLDVPNVKVQEALSQPADLLVVMLGMNDVISPYVDGSEASLDRWVSNYESLIGSLRERIHPGTVALAGITPCTEDLSSPKNQLIDRMNKRVRELAAKLGAVYLPTSETAKEVLSAGRKVRPDFHITYDFVHPNEAGHQAIAIGMLEGLKQNDAARWLRTGRLAGHLQSTGAPSWEIISIRPDAEPGRFTFEIRAHFPTSSDHPNELHITPPDGWTASAATLRHSGDTFTLTGKPDRLRNRFALALAGKPEGGSVEGYLPAPWLVSAGLVQPFWSGETFDSAKARISLDDVIAKNGDFLSASPPELHWKEVFPSLNYAGGESPSNIDFFAIVHPVYFEGGYAARWVYSEKRQDVKIKLSTNLFAGRLFVGLSLNGSSLYQGQLEKEPSKTASVDAVLNPGWNTLVVKINHWRWLWQLAVDVISPDEALRYAAHPPASDAKP